VKTKAWTLIITKIYQLLGLVETKKRVHERNLGYQEKMKKLCDRNVNPKDFKLGDEVLMLNASFEDKGKDGRFEVLWLGPYIVVNKCGQDTFYLSRDEELMDSPLHGQHLEHYP